MKKFLLLLIAVSMVAGTIGMSPAMARRGRHYRRGWGYRGWGWRRPRRRRYYCRVRYVRFPVRVRRCYRNRRGRRYCRVYRTYRYGARRYCYWR